VPALTLSRYEFAPVEVDACNRTFLDVPDPIRRVTRPSDLRAVAGDTDTLFGFAWRAYEDLNDPEQDIRPTSFWDVIAQINNLIDPLPLYDDQDLTVPSGTVLRIPDVDALIGEIRVPPPFFQGSSPGRLSS